jgi:hypothetical protein
MSHAGKRSSNKMLEFAMPKEGIGPQLVKWVRGVVRSNDQLVPALERLRSSHKALLAGKSVTDSEEILWQVEGALKDAERSTNVLRWIRSASRRDHLLYGQYRRKMTSNPRIETEIVCHFGGKHKSTAIHFIASAEDQWRTRAGVDLTLHIVAETVRARCRPQVA